MAVYIRPNGKPLRKSMAKNPVTIQQTVIYKKKSKKKPKKSLLNVPLSISMWSIPQKIKIPDQEYQSIIWRQKPKINIEKFEELHVALRKAEEEDNRFP